MVSLEEYLRDDLRQLSKQLKSNSEETAALRTIFQEFAANISIVSVNDVDSKSPRERLVTMADPQRIALHGALDTYQNGLVLADVASRRQRFTDTAWGRVSVAVGIFTALILTAAAVVTLVHTLSLQAPKP